MELYGRIQSAKFYRLVRNKGLCATCIHRKHAINYRCNKEWDYLYNHAHKDWDRLFLPIRPNLYRTIQVFQVWSQYFKPFADCWGKQGRKIVNQQFGQIPWVQNYFFERRICDLSFLSLIWCIRSDLLYGRQDRDLSLGWETGSNINIKDRRCIDIKDKDLWCKEIQPCFGQGHHSSQAFWLQQSLSDKRILLFRPFQHYYSRQRRNVCYSSTHDWFKDMFCDKNKHYDPVSSRVRHWPDKNFLVQQVCAFWIRSYTRSC